LAYKFYKIWQLAEAILWIPETSAPLESAFIVAGIVTEMVVDYMMNILAKCLKEFDSQVVV